MRISLIEDAMFENIDTPAVLIDQIRVEANMKRLQDYCNTHGIRLRPHIKTHKLPGTALQQINCGAVGVTCQKVGEAEIMADGGVGDILITYNIIGKSKVERVRALNDRIDLAVVADSDFVVSGLSNVLQKSSKPLKVLVECDTGMRRCGVQTIEAALQLAKDIDAAAGLRFGGLMTYPPTGRISEVNAWLDEAKTRIIANGIECPVVSCGNSPDLELWHKAPVVTEHRAGTYIYCDRNMILQGVATEDNCALTVLVTVVSTPTKTRAVIDAGSKALTSDLSLKPGYGLIVGHPGLDISALSEEHGHITSDQPHRLQVGQRLRIIPNHVCPVSNLFDKVHFVRGEKYDQPVSVAARGALT